jgi:hypothetical protein
MKKNTPYTTSDGFWIRFIILILILSLALLSIWW